MGIEPPPLEEFKRLMDSLGPDSMMEGADMISADTDKMATTASGNTADANQLSSDEQLLRQIRRRLAALEARRPVAIEPTEAESIWMQSFYEGGEPSRPGGKRFAHELQWYGQPPSRLSVGWSNPFAMSCPDCVCGS